MASEVDICNLALSHLGDASTVASISPPEGSAQSEHCARFYPIARDTLLEMHPWGFATKRAQLALLTSGWPEWEYAYAQPADALNIIAVLPPDSTDDNAVTLANAATPWITDAPRAAGAYVPQPFSCESNDSGADVIYTDQVNAVLRYSALVTDTTRFTPLFTMALSWHLASLLAGPILKGDAGAAEAKRCAQMAMAFLSQAKNSDTGQCRVNPSHVVPWVSGR